MASNSPFRAGASVEEQLAYYKTQYEQLEVELHEFQASSKDLEAELERDVEESEKRERKLKEQVESLGFEVDEWKTKSKQTRDEANRAQSALQKEITTMRDTSRGLQLRLRDIEVANDNYETQARNTTSSLEDMESKYNVAIERGVLLEEEIKTVEQEREQLRIDAQRLRDELSDLRVEFDITLDKLHHTEATLERTRTKKSAPMHANPARPMSITSEMTAVTPPSPGIASPATKSEASTPPSPPLSDTLTTHKSAPKTPLNFGRKSILANDGNTTTPRPSKMPSRMPRHSRGPSLSGIATPAGASRMGPPRPRPNMHLAENLPRSGSLYQIKGLIGRMQKIEERVQSVRSRLPPSKVPTPTKNSPRTLGPDSIPSSVTVRSNRKRPSNISAASSKTADENAAPPPLGVTDRTSGKRLSFGVTSAAHTLERPTSSSAAAHSSRPSSRASNASNSEANNPFVRPSSRLSIGGSRTPGHYPLNPATHSIRPRSSIGGRGHGHSHSISELAEASAGTPTPRRTTLDKKGVQGVRALTLSSSAAARDGTGGGGGGGMRRTSNGGPRSMAPPGTVRKASGLGETF